MAGRPRPRGRVGVRLASPPLAETRHKPSAPLWENTMVSSGPQLALRRVLGIGQSVTGWLPSRQIFFSVFSL